MKNVLLILDYAYGGYGDVTNALRIGGFLKSRGYNVYQTTLLNAEKGQNLNVNTFHNQIPETVIPEDRERVLQYLNSMVFDMKKLIEKIGESTLLPDTIPDLKKLNPQHYKRVKDLGIHCTKIAYLFDNCEHRGLTKEIRQNIMEGTVGFHTHSAFHALLNHFGGKQEFIRRLTSNLSIIKRAYYLLKEHRVVHIDYELYIFASKRTGNTYGEDSRSRDQRPLRILIDQFAGDDGQVGKNPRSRFFDFAITPIPPENVDGVLRASLYTHDAYKQNSREELVNYLLLNGLPKWLKEPLLKGAWGAYYSGSLGTNGLFFTLLSESLPKMRRKHKQIVYFSFNDDKHFNKYVQPYLHSSISVVNLQGSKELIKSNKKGNPILINVQVPSQVMEGIIGQSSLCSVGAGDGSFNILYNQACQNNKFSFFKYGNKNQFFFFRYLVNVIHEYETMHKSDHEVSNSIFFFGYFEKIFQYYLRTKEINFSTVRTSNPKTSLAVDHPEFGQKVHKYAFTLMKKMFHDSKFIQKFNKTMRALPTFLQKHDELLPIEDLLIDILEGKLPPRGENYKYVAPSYPNVISF